MYLLIRRIDGTRGRPERHGRSPASCNGAPGKILRSSAPTSAMAMHASDHGRAAVRRVVTSGLRVRTARRASGARRAQGGHRPRTLPTAARAGRAAGAPPAGRRDSPWRGRSSAPRAWRVSRTPRSVSLSCSRRPVEISRRAFSSSAHSSTTVSFVYGRQRSYAAHAAAGGRTGGEPAIHCLLRLPLPGAGSGAG